MMTQKGDPHIKLFSTSSGVRLLQCCSDCQASTVIKKN